MCIWLLDENQSINVENIINIVRISGSAIELQAGVNLTTGYQRNVNSLSDDVEYLATKHDLLIVPRTTT